MGYAKQRGTRDERAQQAYGRSLYQHRADARRRAEDFANLPPAVAERLHGPLPSHPLFLGCLIGIHYMIVEAMNDDELPDDEPAEFLAISDPRLMAPPAPVDVAFTPVPFQ